MKPLTPHLTLMALAVVFALTAPLASHAQTASTQSEAAGATTGLGTSHRFKTVQAAGAHCATDIVVWSSGQAQKYSLPGDALYGKGAGFYACKMEADDAGFQPMPR
jgi:hypothetical protein